MQLSRSLQPQRTQSCIVDHRTFGLLLDQIHNRRDFLVSGGDVRFCQSMRDRSPTTVASKDQLDITPPTVSGRNGGYVSGFFSDPSVDTRFGGEELVPPIGFIREIVTP